MHQALIIKLQQTKQKKNSIKNELKKLKTLDLSYFIGKSHFEEDGTQSYVVFQYFTKQVF